jgi:Uma2 family endonuclease
VELKAMTILMPHLSDEQMAELCELNPDLRMEKTAQGELIVMPPTGGETGNRNAIITTQLTHWSWQDGTGITFDSSTGFNLPNGATRSPDAAWVKKSRLAQLTEEEKEEFLPLCPDFVIELKSPSDDLLRLKDKMREYIDNGTELGWLIDTKTKKVFIYRPNEDVVVMDKPESLSGDPVLSGFVLNLEKIWNPGF